MVFRSPYRAAKTTPRLGPGSSTIRSIGARKGLGGLVALVGLVQGQG